MQANRPSEPRALARANCSNARILRRLVNRASSSSDVSRRLKPAAQDLGISRRLKAAARKGVPPHALRSAACLAFLLLAMPAFAGAQVGREALIEKALDEPTEITLDSIQLGEALRTISQRTGVKIVMPADVMALVPLGAETMIRHVEIANVSLRKGLTELLAPLGMTFELRGRHVAVIPMAALRCLSRAPTWEELDTLTQLRAMRPGIHPEDLGRLRELLQFQVGAPQSWSVMAEAIQNVGAGTGDEVLSVACANLGWAWCLSGRGLVITSPEQRIRHLLQQRISFRMNYVPLIDVLSEIGRRAGVGVHTEPGALAALPIYLQKNFSLNVHEKPATEVLEAVVAATGLGYSIQPDGILFFLPEGEGGSQLASVAQEEPAEPDRDPYVGKIVVELENGKSVEWLIRRSELPPDLRERRRQDLRAAFESLRKQSE